MGNGPVDPEAVQLALIPYTLAGLGKPRLLGLAIDWTMWDTITPKWGQGAAFAADRALLRALPPGARPVILADCGFARSEVLRWLQQRGVEYTEPDGRRWKLGEEDLKSGEYTYPPGFRITPSVSHDARV